MKRPRRYLSAPAEFRFGVLHGEVQADGPICFDIAFLLGNPRPVQKQGVQHLGVIG